MDSNPMTGFSCFKEAFFLMLVLLIIDISSDNFISEDYLYIIPLIPKTCLLFDYGSFFNKVNNSQIVI
jgi:hypothetical protein